MKKSYKEDRPSFTNHIKADVIILGCSLPGIVAAHNLKKKFGDTMDIVVLDLVDIQTKTKRKGTGVSVAFQDYIEDAFDNDEEESSAKPPTLVTSQQNIIRDHVTHFFLDRYSDEFNIPIPGYLQLEKIKSPLLKLFQDINGSKFTCTESYQKYLYLGYLERFELLQYQTLLDLSMTNLFQPFDSKTESDLQRELDLDQTTMETHMSTKLYSGTSKDIMRTIVELVCGVTADKISVLFFLHQCFHVSSSKNLVDGDNIRLREKILGHFRKRLLHQLQQSIADITVSTKPIKEIRTFADQQLVLEPEIGETDYICKLLAMALRPDQVRNIVIKNNLVPEKEMNVISAMVQGQIKKFIIEYKTNFWEPLGYSGEILSVRGPIVWAMQRPTMTTTRDTDTHSALIGYLKVDCNISDSKQQVVEQLVNLFGEEAANPRRFTEYIVRGLTVPRIEEYTILRKLLTDNSTKSVEWGALDIFAEGDMPSAVEAGHAAYVHLLRVLRPQAVTYDDIAYGLPPHRLYEPFDVIGASVNVLSTTKVLLVCVALVAAFTMIRRLRQ
ncbi:hypothetical protein NE865_03052 [Phthorimaea operculella]|nr:hypothetical protein NE865_03052 [Phthorimaea operculella]